MSIKLYHHWDFSDSTREMGIKTKENNNNKRNKKKKKHSSENGHWKQNKKK